MRLTRPAVAVTLCTTALVAGALGAPSSAGAASALHFTASYANGHMTDVSPKGESIGDSDVSLFTLRDAKAAVAGVVSTQCVLLRGGKKPLAQCSGDAVLPGGTIVLGGVTTGTPATTYAIVGGTGAYASAAGTASFLPGTSSIAVTLTLRSAG